MTASTTVNNEPVVHAGSGHVAVATSPDLCIVPGNPNPQPFNNWVESKRIAKDKTTTVTIQQFNVCVALTQWGPESDPAHAGTDGGASNGAYRGYARAASWSPDVFCEGGAVVRKGDQTQQNGVDDTFNTDGMVVDAEEAWQLLKDKHGRIPDQHFCMFISGYNAASKELINALPEVTDWMNAKLKELGHDLTVTQEELAANFLAEGGDKVVFNNQTEGLHGYGDCGIDSLLRPSTATESGTVDYPWRNWVRDEDREFAEDPTNQGLEGLNDGVGATEENQLPVKNLELARGLWLNAGLYTASKARAAGYMAKLTPPVDMASLPRGQQLYWGTRFYNSNRAYSVEIMQKYGAHRPYQWKGDEKKARENKHQPHQNAKRRVSTFELMLVKCGAASPP